MAAFDLFGSDRTFLMSDTVNGKDATSSLSSDAATAAAPTVASFSPNQQTASRSRDQTSILIHQKSPLLVSTPPQVTRALAYSHPFILPLNKLAGLLAWRTDDPWESFLFMSIFWFLVLYGDAVLRWAGPIVLVSLLVFGMYSRRYSPLSSTVWSDDKKRRPKTEADHRKTLDEILHTLYNFTESCDILLDPFLRLTEYLSTQSSATSATTRPALTTLFIRILAFTPFWIALTLPPLRLITTKRIVLAMGTVVMSWHSQPARVSRTILWRSKTVRKATSLLTGLQFSTAPLTVAPPPFSIRAHDAAAKVAKTRPKGKHSTDPIRFTFTVYENQRRWIGLGWTTSLFAYERQAWTDEHLNTVPDPDHYQLPDTENETTKWRWVLGGEWHVEGASVDDEKSAKRVGGGGGGDDSGWVYYDNKWEDGRREDGWSRYTRRRKWLRDAELVEVNPDGTEVNYSASEPAEATITQDTSALSKKKPGWFNRNPGSVTASGATTPTRNAPNARHRPTKSAPSADVRADRSDAASGRSTLSARSRGSADEDDVATPLERVRQFDWDRTLNEDMVEQLS
ncbi:integral peroxisomal membrane peroxin-domain-containing protein [Neohortaea acidophila]|uniref:Integral peroxisomal membrane peroxin-domain-containing protein n=1 Tax=Neohortaea acidophila TaxID=245834 RepID=A0A6A6Q7N5_9PEZI|nr:integral peroxisomal membrane peroxin-domain-containing protein [Neohortaea acidophila]KAF2488059.1 integral peroxisomal membrane peroxin-domain-containing protein [Neohortaea acidophila]